MDVPKVIIVGTKSFSARSNHESHSRSLSLSLSQEEAVLHFICVLIFSRLRSDLVCDARINLHLEYGSSASFENSTKKSLASLCKNQKTFKIDFNISHHNSKHLNV